MILFVFEGRKTEPSLFKTLEHLYFKNPNEQKICCFGYNIYEFVSQVYSYYKSTDFIQFSLDKKTKELRPITKEREQLVKENWEYLKEQNIKKANYICYNSFEYPKNKEAVNQDNIFNSELK